MGCGMDRLLRMRRVLMICRIVERNLSTALILEDDADWDERVREQLMNFGGASRTLSGMIAQSDASAQAQVPATANPDHADSVVDAMELAKRSTALLHVSNKLPSSDPYSHDWDVLWLGHCGTALPPHRNSSLLSPLHVADRLMLLNDTTVPSPSYLRPSHTAQLDSIASIYPPHTRIYHRSHGTLCTLAYAVTQRGARKILYEHGIRNLSRGYDFALSEWCDGLTKNMGERPMCLTSSPPICTYGPCVVCVKTDWNIGGAALLTWDDTVSHYWPEGGQMGGGRSAIVGVGAGGVESGSAYLVESVRGKLEREIEGDEAG